MPSATTGVYLIQTWNTSTYVNVYCDMDTDGGGWTVSRYIYVLQHIIYYKRFLYNGTYDLFIFIFFFIYFFKDF